MKLLVQGEHVPRRMKGKIKEFWMIKNINAACGKGEALKTGETSMEGECREQRKKKKLEG